MLITGLLVRSVVKSDEELSWGVGIFMVGQMQFDLMLVCI